MPHPAKDEAKPLQAVGRVLDSRWMMALAVSAVLVAIVWALLDKGLTSQATEGGTAATTPATVELLGVPDGARVLLDGREIVNRRFGVTPGTRHLLEVSDDAGRSWRQVFLADGSLSLVVELRTHFVEVAVPPTDQKPAEK
jgi:ferric-dicitrate binding protein FerR (iron transport regulator)